MAPRDKNIVIWDPNSLKDIPDDLLRTAKKGQIHLVGSDKDKMKNAISARRVTRLEDAGVIVVDDLAEEQRQAGAAQREGSQEDLSIIPKKFKERIVGAIRDADNPNEALKKLKEVYRKYDEIVGLRTVPHTVGELKAGLVISADPVLEFMRLFYADIPETLTRKFGMDPHRVQELLADRDYQMEFDRICMRMFQDHTRMLCSACAPTGIVYCAAPFASLDCRALAQATALNPDRVIEEYNRLAMAWQRGFAVEKFEPFAAELFQRRHEAVPPIRWIVPTVVLNAKGSPLMDQNLRLVRTRVFGQTLDRDMEDRMLFQSLIWTPVLEDAAVQASAAAPEKGGETQVLPPLNPSPTLAQTFEYVLPLLREEPSVQKRLDILIETLHQEQSDEKGFTFCGRLEALRSSKRDVAAVQAIVGDLLADDAISKLDQPEMVLLLLADGVREGETARRRFEEFEKKEPPAEEAARVEAQEEAQLLQLLEEIIQPLAVNTGKDREFEVMLRKKITEINAQNTAKDAREEHFQPLAGKIDPGNIFVLDHCAYLKVDIQGQEACLRFYRKRREPFNVLRKFADLEFLSTLGQAVPADLQMEKERRGEVKRPDIWEYVDVLRILHLVRAVEEGEGDACVSAWKELDKQGGLMREEFFTLMNHVDKTRLFACLKKSRDEEAIEILRKYRTIAEKMAAYEKRVAEGFSRVEQESVKQRIDLQNEKAKIVKSAALDIRENEEDHSAKMIVWLAQYIQDRSLGKESLAELVRGQLRDVLEGKPARPSPEQPATEAPPEAAPEDQWRVMTESIMKFKDELVELRSRGWSYYFGDYCIKRLPYWGGAAVAVAPFCMYYCPPGMRALLAVSFVGLMLFDVAFYMWDQGMDTRRLIRAREQRIRQYEATRKDRLDELREKISVRILPADFGDVTALLDEMTEQQKVYVLERIDEIPKEDTATFLSVAALPMAGDFDAGIMDALCRRLQDLKKLGIDVTKNMPLKQQRMLVRAIYDSARERIGRMSFFYNGVYRGRVQEVITADTAVFLDREIAFQLMLEVIKAKYGEGLLLMAEVGGTAELRTNILDQDVYRSSGHNLQLVFKDDVSLREVDTFLKELKRHVTGLGAVREPMCPVSFELHQRNTFLAPGLGTFTDHVTRAALTNSASFIDQCIAALENKVYYESAQAKGLMKARLNAMKNAALKDADLVPREAAGYAIFQRILMEECEKINQPQRLASLVVRSAFANMLFDQLPQVMEEVVKILEEEEGKEARVRRTFPRILVSYVHRLADMYYSADPEKRDLVKKACKIERESYAGEYSPETQQFIIAAADYVTKTADDLSRRSAAGQDEDKNALEGMGFLWPAFINGGLRRYRRGESLVAQGAHTGSVYYIVSGEAKVLSKNGKETRLVRKTFKPGSILSEKCIFKGLASDADVVASNDLLVMEVNKKVFWEKFDPPVRKALLEMLINEEISNLEIAAGAMARGEDPGGVMLETLLARAGEMKTAYRDLGATREQVAMFQHRVNDALSMKNVIVTRDLATAATEAAAAAVAAAKAHVASFKDIVTELAPTLWTLPTFAGRVELIQETFKHKYNCSNNDRTIQMLQVFKEDVEHRAQIADQLKVAGVLPEDVADRLVKDAMLEVPPDAVAWDRKFRETLRQQGVALAPGKNTVLVDEEGHALPVKEVALEAAARPNHLPLFIDISPGMDTVKYYDIPNGCTLDDFSVALRNNEIKPFLSIPLKGREDLMEQQYLITPSPRALPYLLQHAGSDQDREKIRAMMDENQNYGKRYVCYGPEGQRKIVESWDRDVDKDVWSTTIDEIYQLKVLSDAGVLRQMRERKSPAVLVVGTGSGRTAATLVQSMPSGDLYYADISPYALASTKYHLEMNAVPEGVRQHAILGPGLRGIHGPDTSSGKFDTGVIFANYVPTPDPEGAKKTGYSQTGLIHEVCECAGEKLNPDNPDAQLLMVVSSLAQEDMARYIEGHGKDYFIEPLGLPLQVPLKIDTMSEAWKEIYAQKGQLVKHENAQARYMEPYSHFIQTYRIRLKTSQLKKTETDTKRAMVRERLKNLYHAGEQAGRDVDPHRAFQEVFGLQYGNNRAYQAFIEDFSGMGPVNFQLWHTGLPVALTLAENIKLLAMTMQRAKQSAESSGRSVVSLDLRDLTRRLKEPAYWEALRELLSRPMPEVQGNIGIVQTPENPACVVSITPAVAPPAAVPARVALAMPPAKEVPAEAAEAPVLSAVDQFNKNILTPPAVSAQDVPPKIANYALRNKHLEVVDSKWLVARREILPARMAEHLATIAEEYIKNGLTLKVVPDMAEPVFSLKWMDKVDVYRELTPETLLERDSTGKPTAVVIPIGALALGIDHFFKELEPSLQRYPQYCAREVIALSLGRSLSVARLAQEKVQVSESQLQTWIDQFALWVTVLGECENCALPARMLQRLKDRTVTSNTDLQAYVEGTDTALAVLGENKLFELFDQRRLRPDDEMWQVLPGKVIGNLKRLITNNRKLVSEHCMDILTEREVSFRSSQEHARVRREIAPYHKMMQEVREICERKAPGVVHQIEDSGISLYFLLNLILTSRNYCRTLGTSGQALDTMIETFVREDLGGLRDFDSKTAPAIASLIAVCDEQARDIEIRTLVERMAMIKAQREALGHPWIRWKASTFPYNPLLGTSSIDIASGHNLVDLADGMNRLGAYIAVDNSHFVATYLNEYFRLKGFRSANMYVLEEDVTKMEKPVPRVGLVRCKNAWSYVAGLDRKLLEMADWLEPGGQLVLEEDPDNERRAVMRASMTALMRDLVAKGWKFEYSFGHFDVNNRVQMDRVVLTKPGALTPGGPGMDWNGYLKHMQDQFGIPAGEKDYLFAPEVPTQSRVVDALRYYETSP